MLLVFIEEIAFNNFLFTNIAKFKFFLFFSAHTHKNVKIENLLKIRCLLN